MRKSDVYRIQMRKDTELHEFGDKTEAELRQELPRVDEERMKLKQMQDIEVDIVAKIQAAKVALAEIEDESAVLAKAARNDEILRLHCALASQMCASVEMLKVRGDIVEAIRDVQPLPLVLSHPAMISPPVTPFVAKYEASFKSLPASTTLELSAIGGNSGDHLSDEELWLSNRRRLRARPEWNSRYCINDPTLCQCQACRTRRRSAARNVRDAPNSRTHDDEFFGALDDRLGDLCKSVTSNDDERRIDGLKQAFGALDHVYPRDHFPTDARTELQQPVTPFTKAFSAAEGSNHRRPTQGTTWARPETQQPIQTSRRRTTMTKR
jgi:hypothetical protein